MHEFPGSASVHAQTAFVNSKVLTLIERMRKLKLLDGEDLIEHVATRAAKPNVIRINLRRLGQLLYLTKLEQVWLETAVVWTLSGIALPDIQIANETMRWQLLAGVLDQPVAADDPAWQTASRKLRCLALIAPRRYRDDGRHWLGDDLLCYRDCVQAISTRHTCHAQLLSNVLQPHLDVEFVNYMMQLGHETVYQMRMPPIVEDSYERHRDGKRLFTEHLLALLDWWCDWPVAGSAGRRETASTAGNAKAKPSLVIHAHELQRLAAYSAAPSMRHAIQAAAIAACRARKPLSAFDLLKALYDAAN